MFTFEYLVSWFHTGHLVTLGIVPSPVLGREELGATATDVGEHRYTSLMALQKLQSYNLKFIISLNLETHGTDNHSRKAENNFATVNFTVPPWRPLPGQLIRHQPELVFACQLKGGPF